MNEESGKQTVLIVDDEPVNIRILLELLSPDYQIRVAVDGETALEIVESPNPPDLVLLDVMIPGMDGYEVCRRIKSNPRTENIPVLFITAKTGEEDESRGFEMGAVDYIAKPFIPAVVKARVKTHMRLKLALTEKELLLKEAHHRIKNNMFIISSLLSLQSMELADPSAVSFLEDARNRIHSMMVLHDKLYRSDNLAAISTREYLASLVEEIIGNFPNRSAITTDMQIEDRLVDAKILSSIGIILNELLTNAMKYAFYGRDGGSITISLSFHGNQGTLIVGDDGVGVPSSVDMGNPEGFGLRLIGLLAKQLNGRIRLGRHKGTVFITEFEV